LALAYLGISPWRPGISSPEVATGSPRLSRREGGQFLRDRDPGLWIDELPPEKGSEIGVGKENARQTSLYREAVGRVLAEAKLRLYTLQHRY
jgi:hypothetical protein